MKVLSAVKDEKLAMGANATWTSSMTPVWVKASLPPAAKGERVSIEKRG